MIFLPNSFYHMISLANSFYHMISFPNSFYHDISSKLFLSHDISSKLFLSHDIFSKLLTLQHIHTTSWLVLIEINKNNSISIFLSIFKPFHLCLKCSCSEEPNIAQEIKYFFQQLPSSILYHFLWYPMKLSLSLSLFLSLSLSLSLYFLFSKFTFEFLCSSRTWDLNICIYNAAENKKYLFKRCQCEAYSKSIKTEAVFTKTEINNVWIINFLQSNLLSIQDIYFNGVSIGWNTSKTSLLI